jgi:Right handed beta helix region
MKHAAIVIAAGLAFGAALPSTPASATFVRTFVSGTGSDSNPCTRTQPCLTFAFAITQTTAGGEIDVLDPGGYGPLVIDKAISIVNDGVGTVGVRALSGGTAITINAGAADAVSLRGLTIEGAGIGLNGIRFNSGQSLTIENSAIRHFTSDGIQFSPNASSKLAVSSTLVADNGDAIIVSPTGAGAVTAVFNRVETNNNAGTGITVDGEFSTGTVKATVSDSVAAGNSSAGFVAFSSPGHAPPTLMLFHSVAANNDFGLSASGGATVRVAQSMLTGNRIGWSAPGGFVQSYADNYIDGNAGGETAPPSTAKK